MTRKTNVTQTSIDAYRDLDLADCERQVLAYMKPGQAYTDSEIAKALGKVPGWVSARRNRLMEAGRIEYVCNVKCPVTGTTVKAHRLVANQRELELA